MPHRRAFGFTRSELAIATMAALVIGLLVVRFLNREDLLGGETERPRSSQPSFALPPRSLDASAIVGRSRRDVRLALGEPETTYAEKDVFEAGPEITVTYKDGVASAFTLKWPNAGLHERSMRRWLHLPADGPLQIGDHRYLVALFVGDDDRLALEDQGPVPGSRPAESPAAVHRRPVLLADSIQEDAGVERPLTHAADDLIRAFPEMPPLARRSCERRSGSESTYYAGSGFDATVSYVLGGDDKAASLTILDSPVARTEDQCRALLTRNGMSPGRERETVDETTRYFTSGSVDALYTWVPGRGAQRPSCSISLCRRGAPGARDSCVPEN